MATTFDAGLPFNSPTCFICSNHPLAVSLIKNVLSSDPELRAAVRPYSNDCKPPNGGRLEVLILDTCSVRNWTECFQQWRSKGGATIGLMPSDSQNANMALEMLHLGAAGILRFSEDLPEELLPAIHAVIRGRVWIPREVMDAYLRWTNSTIRHLTFSAQQLTVREKQILHLLQQPLSNRAMAQKLAISERTIKFHVSNILRKLRLASRRELQPPERAARQCLLSFHELEPVTCPEDSCGGIPVK